MMPVVNKTSSGSNKPIKRLIGAGIPSGKRLITTDRATTRSIHKNIPVSKTSSKKSVPRIVSNPPSKAKQIKSQVFYSAKQGPREYMEDTYQVMHFKIGARIGTFYGVFDGHGGKDVSYELVHEKRGLFPFLIESIKKFGDKNLPKLIQEKFLEYDNRLFDGKFTAGSTAIIALHFNNKIYLVNLGDSRGLLFTKRMKDQIVSLDHKPQKPVERRRIYKAGHYVTPFRTSINKNKIIGDVMMGKKNQPYIYLHGTWEPITLAQYKSIINMSNEADVNRVSNSLALSRAFGDFYLKVDEQKKYLGKDAAVSCIPDIQILDLNKHRGEVVYLLLASDGFWDVNRNTEKLRRLMMTHPDPQRFVEDLIDASLKPPKSSTDNTTIVFAKIKA